MEHLRRTETGIGSSMTLFDYDDRCTANSFGIDNKESYSRLKSIPIRALYECCSKDSIIV